MATITGPVRLRLPVDDASPLRRSLASIADGRDAASIPAESPALCTICDHRLTDPAIRACSVRDCPHAQRDAA